MTTTTGFRIDLEPLRTPAYRRFVIAWSLSLASLWVFYTAQTWTFLESSGTAAAVAYLPIALVIPVPIALIVGGLLTDSRGPKTILVLAQAATALTIGFIGVLDLAHQLTFVPTLATGLLMGVFGGLGSVPAQALMVRMVDRRLIASAYALSLVTVGLGRLVGGPIGGVIVQAVGSAPAFAVSAGGVLLATLLFVTLPDVEPLDAAGARISRRDLADAIGWVRYMPAAIAVIAFDAILAGLVYPYTAVVPVIARDLLGGGAADLGVLIAAGGVGVLVGGTIITPLARRLGQGRLLVAGVLAAAAGIAGLAMSGSVLTSSVLAAVAGGASNVASVTSGLLLQTMSPPRLRGRVLALDGVVANIVNPASLLGVGLLVDRIGAQVVLLAMSGLIALAVGSIVLAHRPVVGLDVDGQGRAIGVPPPRRRSA